MKCPRCKKQGAKKSSYYPHLIVHKCENDLLEVGKVSEPDGTQIHNQTYYNMEIQESFTLKELFIVGQDYDQWRD